jgi:hypothetical protein
VSDTTDHGQFCGVVLLRSNTFCSKTLGRTRQHRSTIDNFLYKTALSDTAHSFNVQLAPHRKVTIWRTAKCEAVTGSASAPLPAPTQDYSGRPPPEILDDDARSVPLRDMGALLGTC